ncbi:MAG: glycosyltransferase [Lachnospiraceae bacterium]|nr:glycosyltransferase [Lachnospiraceae bacterium]
MKSPLFTIITVCYQAESVIEATIRSVLDQSFTDFEYIIVDGASTDGTNEIIKKYLSDPRLVHISEPDKGLYDAMNKGIRLSKGSYLNFMNAGDCLADPDVLKDVSRVIEDNPDVDFIYGDVLYIYENGSEGVRKYPWYCSTKLYQLLGDCINHQSMFAKRHNYAEREFDLETYKVNCYRDWISYQCSTNKKFKAMNRITCRFSFGGTSFTLAHFDEHLSELDLILKRYYPLGYPIYVVIRSIRKGKLSSKLLHKAYELVFIRKK